MDFFEFADNLQNYSVDNFIDDLAIELDSDKDVIALQTKQWDKGEDSEGKVLGYYTRMTEILSGGRKKQGDRYNLLDTGDFRQHTYLLSTQKGKDLLFDFDSSGANTSKILTKIGSTVFGLQDKNKDEFTTIAVEKAIQLLNTNLKLK